MELAKTHQSFYGSMLEGSSHVEFPNPLSSPSHGIYGLDDQAFENPSSKMVSNNNSTQVISHSPPLSSSSSANSSNSGFAFYGSSYHLLEEAHDSLLNFKGVELEQGGFMQSLSGSLLSFQQDEGRFSPYDFQRFNNPSEYSAWDGASSMSQNHHYHHHHHDQHQQLKLKGGSSASEWLYGEETITVDAHQECETQPTCFNKRPHMEEENMKALKKQCTSNSASKKPSSKPKSSISKDPQSIAAKNRRERISERLKILQDLVPNGSKVDLVTMLEKAISYVKFLQLQVKVLATDEFWPAAGGKAPDISQVKEAIEAILSSQRTERTSISNSK